VLNAALLETPLTPETLLEEAPPADVQIAVHDATRIAWNASVSLPERGWSSYELDVELEMPSNVANGSDPWHALQSYARLDAPAVAAGVDAPEAFRRAVVAVSVKLARARDGFVRHCTLIRAAAVVDAAHVTALGQWLEVAGTVVTDARRTLLRPDAEGALADEFLSAQYWAIATDCARSLAETQKALAERPEAEVALLDAAEAHLAKGLAREIAYRRQAGFKHAEPLSTAQLGGLVTRMRWLKKHFEGVLFLESESYQVITRLGGWFSAVAAALAYLWFFFWQLALERRPASLGSGIVALGLLTAVVYASRERLKEAGRNWVAGRIQRIFAQRVTRHRLPRRERQRGDLLVVARESISDSAVRRPSASDPSLPAGDTTVLRFVDKGKVYARIGSSGQVRLAFRYDLSHVLPRLHDAVRGFATPEAGSRVRVVDVPREYEFPLRATLHQHGRSDARVSGVLVLNKNGLRRFEESA
jgi:hypothetical protein